MTDNNELKKRYLTYVIELKENAHITWNDQDECLELRNSTGEISDKHLIGLAESYEREGKQPKILRMLRNPNDGVLHFSPESSLYDRYLAIDTSHIQFDGYLVCATSCLCIEQPMMKGEQITVHIWPRLIFLAPIGSKPERYGWMKMIDALLKNTKHNPNWTYGVIVDSDLNDLQKINSREKPIIGDFYVPNNVSLIYASADTGMESLLNKLIQQTDRVAKKTLNSFLKDVGKNDSIEPLHGYKELMVLNGDCEVKISL